MFNKNNLKEISPCFVLEETLLRKNLELMQYVQQQAGVDIILAFKGFSMWSAFPMVRKYLKGATASSLNEARLCYEEMQTGAHTYMAAYIPQEFEELLKYSSHLSFNSIQQFVTYREKVKKYSSKISCAIRVNPECAVVDTDLYNPAVAGSRLGETIDNFKGELPEGLEGLHFHALCESSSHDLEKVLEVFEEKFGHWLPQLQWVNMGGGHLMTRAGYDVEHLIQVLKKFRAKHDVKIILEPGSAVAWQTGSLYATVLDIVENKKIKTAICDISFTAHMPDCLEMPYRPKITGASDPIAGKPSYRIGGMSCLSGDYMDEYSFETELKIGDQLIFEDMMHYTMVKTTTFNGVGHPCIAIEREGGAIEVIKKFAYEDFKNRLS